MKTPIAHTPCSNSKKRKGHPTVGTLLTVAGLLLLIKQSGWIPHELNWSNAMWPFCLIAAGFVVLFSSRIGNKGSKGH